MRPPSAAVRKTTSILALVLDFTSHRRKFEHCSVSCRRPLLAASCDHKSAAMPTLQPIRSPPSSVTRRPQLPEVDTPSPPAFTVAVARQRERAAEKSARPGRAEK